MSADIDQPPAPRSPAPRFCPVCGGPLTPDTPCPRCASKRPAVQAADEERLAARPVVASLGLYAAILFIHIVAGIVLFTADLTAARSLELQWAVQLLDTSVVAGWCVVRRRDLGPMLTRGCRPAWFIAAFLTSFVTWGIATILMEGVRHFFPTADGSLTAEHFEAGYGWTSIVLSICVQPGIVEELAFRGVVLGALLRILRPHEAIAVSAALFAILHLTPVAFPHLLLMGAVLGWFCLRSGSIYPGMLLHFCHNLWCCIAEQLDLFGSST